jgi:hypothetical protein
MDLYPLKRFLAKTTDTAVYYSAGLLSSFDRLMRHQDRFGQTNPLALTAGVVGYALVSAVPTYYAVKAIDQPSIESPTTEPMRAGDEKAEITTLKTLAQSDHKAFIYTLTYNSKISEASAVQLAQNFAKSHGGLGQYGRSQTTLTAADFTYRDECLADIRYTRQSILPADTNLNLTARCMMDARKADHESDLSNSTRTMAHAFGLVAFGIAFAGIGANATPVYRARREKRAQADIVN